MTDSDDLAEPGGATTVSRWLNDLYGECPGRSLWTVLDDRLRLALAQGWVFGTSGRHDDDLAEELAADDASHPAFEKMLRSFIGRWRSVYTTLRYGSGILNRAILVGADMELVVLTAPENIGWHPAGSQLMAHSFITRLEGDDWMIAALARRLPVPGWPPSEETIHGLEVGA